MQNAAKKRAEKMAPRQARGHPNTIRTAYLLDLMEFS